MIIESFDEWIEFRDYYNDRGFVELLGLFKYEDVHNNYLNNILDEKNPYGYSLKPMMYFLKLINSKNKELFNDLSNENDIKNLDVKVRKKLIKSGIPDLFITFNYKDKKYVILLEAKLGSDEHDKQCKKYYNEVIEFNEFDEKIFLYLTLDGRNPESSNKYYPISYQELIDYVYDPLIDEKPNNISLTVEEYLKGFNSLYVEGLVNDYKDIPITNKGRELTKNLFNRIKNSELSEDEINKIINDNNIYFIRIFLNNVNKIDAIKNDSLLSRFPKLEDLKSKYFVENKECKASECVYEIFRRININDEDFDYINLAPDGYKYIYTEEEYNDLKHYRNCYSKDYYGKLILNGKEYYYAIYSLSEDEAKELRDKLKEKYQDVFRIEYGYRK